MKFLQTSGLVAVAIMATMAFAGAGAASAATQLCKATKDPCPVGESYGAGTTIEAKSIEGGAEGEKVTKPTLTSPLGNLSCESTIKGSLSTTETPTISVEAKNLTWSSCSGGTAETVTAGTIQIHHDAEHNGVATFKGFVIKVTQVGVTCYYELGLEGTLTGGADPVIDITAEPKVIDNATHDSNNLCPSKAPWHMTYTISSPQPVYVTTVEGTQLCKATGDPCPAGERYGAGAAVEAKSIEGGAQKVAKPTLTSPLGNLSCESTIKGSLEAEALTTPTISVEAKNLTWSSCSGGTAETITAGTIQIHHDAEHNGVATFKGFVIKVTQVGVTCYYELGLEGTLTGGADPVIDITAEPKVIDNATHDSHAFCPSKAPWHATYTISSPQPVYVTTA